MNKSQLPDKLEFVSFQLSLEFYLHSLFPNLWKTRRDTSP